MAKTTSSFLSLTCLITLIGSETAAVSKDSPRALLLPHDHGKHEVEINSKPDEGITNFNIEKIALSPDVEKANRAVNSDHSWSAFTIDTSSDHVNYYSHLIVEEASTGTHYEIKSFDFPQRPFSDLVWADKGHLVFDIWMQPHGGIHYKIDILNKKPEFSASFHE